MSKETAEQKAERLRDEALDCLLSWEAGRQVLNAKISEMRSHWCEEAGHPEIGDMGQMACWQSSDASLEAVATWCKPCQKRDELMRDVQRLKKNQSVARQKMQRAANKLFK